MRSQHHERTDPEEPFDRVLGICDGEAHLRRFAFGACSERQGDDRTEVDLLVHRPSGADSVNPHDPRHRSSRNEENKRAVDRSVDPEIGPASRTQLIPPRLRRAERSDHCGIDGLEIADAPGLPEHRGEPLRLQVPHVLIGVAGVRRRASCREDVLTSKLDLCEHRLPRFLRVSACDVVGN